MKVLMSIKPEFAEKIFQGKKKFEFRRTIFKNPDIRTVVVYASYPVMKVIGEFEIDHIMEKDIASLWSKTQKHSGISKECFFNYFNKKESGFAIKIKSVKRYQQPKSITLDFNVMPPQSFLYLR